MAQWWGQLSVGEIFSRLLLPYQLYKENVWSLNDWKNTALRMNHLWGLFSLALDTRNGFMKSTRSQQYTRHQSGLRHWNLKVGCNIEINDFAREQSSDLSTVIRRCASFVQIIVRIHGIRQKTVNSFSLEEHCAMIDNIIIISVIDTSFEGGRGSG